MIKEFLKLSYRLEEISAFIKSNFECLSEVITCGFQINIRSPLPYHQNNINSYYSVNRFDDFYSQLKKSNVSTCSKPNDYKYKLNDITFCIQF